MNKIIFITGSTGYIGSQLTKKIDTKSTFFINKSSIKDNFYVFNNKNEKFGLSEFINKEIIVVHLATFFSKSLEDEKKIIDANINFGNLVLKNIGNLNISKSIYLNSMYKFYNDINTRELLYTKTKTEFSEIIKNHSLENNYIFEEIFLDNTFGGIDKRKKIVPLIIESLLKKEGNPINNPENKMNLMYLDDVIERIKISINSQDGGSNLFINEKSLALSSIYNFLHEFLNTKEINEEYLKFYDNEYITNSLKIDHKNINLSSIPDELINMLSI